MGYSVGIARPRKKWSRVIENLEKRKASTELVKGRNVLKSLIRIV